MQNNVIRRAIAALLVAITVSVVAAPGAEAGGACIDVRATGTGRDLGEFRTVADIFVGHLRIGSTAAEFTPTEIAPVVSFTGPIVFTARAGLGTLTVASAGTFDVATGAFRSEGPVTASTGLFRGATGTLVFAGVQTGTTFTETVTGRLCAGRPSALATAFGAA